MLIEFLFCIRHWYFRISDTVGKKWRCHFHGSYVPCPMKQFEKLWVRCKMGFRKNSVEKKKELYVKKTDKSLLQWSKCWKPINLQFHSDSNIKSVIISVLNLSCSFILSESLVDSQWMSSCYFSSWCFTYLLSLPHKTPVTLSLTSLFTHMYTHPRTRLHLNILPQSTFRCHSFQKGLGLPASRSPRIIHLYSE